MIKGCEKYMQVEIVKGENKGKVLLYALSTCGWCKKTKELLEEMGVEYSYVYVDLLEGEERDETMEEVRKWNPRCSFPTLVIKDEKCITGYDEAQIKEALS
jgi:glutaredoxin